MGALTITALAASLRDGSASSRALVERSLARADEQAGLNAFLTLDREGALAAAVAADAELAGGHCTASPSR